jgi:hypothetical protein
MRAILGFACALALALPAWAAPIPEPQESAQGFKTFDLPEVQKGVFEFAFDAVALADRIDCFTGIAADTPRMAADVAAIVRFNDGGTIDVRNGAIFAAEQKLPYSAGKTYRVRMVIDIPKKTYSVFVTPAGGAEVLLAKDYAFRSGQGSVQSLAKLVLAGYKGRDGTFVGPHRVSGFSLKPAPTGAR